MRTKTLFLFIIMVLTISAAVQAQDRCGTKAPKIKPVYRDSASIAQREQAYRTQATYPLIIRLFIVVFSEDDGTNVAASDSIIYARVQDMANFFRPRDICFVLGGIQHRRSTTFLYMDADEEEGDLAELAREGFLTIFLHRNLWNDEGSLNGIAYDIVNPYLSLDGDRMEDIPSLMAHETGHCFGLLHTFEDAYGEENVNRTGDCRDCEGDGDSLCDTPADRETDPDWFNDNCEYTGNRRDECGVPLQMAPTNIMSYGRRACRDHFTNRQGQVMRDEILYELGELFPMIAPEVHTVLTTGTYSTGTVIATARDQVYFATNNLTVSNTAQMTASANEVVVNPGTTLRPGSGGYSYLIANKYCQ